MAVVELIVIAAVPIFTVPFITAPRGSTLPAITTSSGNMSATDSAPANVAITNAAYTDVAATDTGPTNVAAAYSATANMAAAYAAHAADVASDHTAAISAFRGLDPSIGCRTTGTTPGAPRRRARNRTLPPLPTEETFPRTLNRSV